MEPEVFSSQPLKRAPIWKFREWLDERREARIIREANAPLDACWAAYDTLIKHECDAGRIEMLKRLRAGFGEDNK